MELTTSQLQDELAQGRTLTIIDVRESWEWDLCHIPGSVHMPLSTLPERMGELDATHGVVTVCHKGARSLQAARYLKANGIEQVRSLRGGIEAYAVDVDSSIARY